MGRFGRLIFLLIAVGASLLLFQWLYLGDAAPREVWNSMQASVKEHVHDVLSPETLSNSETVHKALRESKLIPDSIYDFKPKFQLDVEWASGHAAQRGNIVQPEDGQKQPSIKLSKFPDTMIESANKVIKKDQYILAMTDPDAPSRENPRWAEYCHWIAQGLPLNSDAETGEWSKELQDVWEYKPMGPPAKTGEHRYLFLVLTPANGTTDPLHLSKPEVRQNWGTGKQRHGVKQWAKQNGLVPVAANYIVSQSKEQ